MKLALIIGGVLCLWSCAAVSSPFSSSVPWSPATSSVYEYFDDLKEHSASHLDDEQRRCLHHRARFNRRRRRNTAAQLLFSGGANEVWCDHSDGSMMMVFVKREKKE